MKKKLNNQGTTLVEIMVASAILILAVSGILTSYLRCMEFTETSRNMSRAVQAAQAQMELIRSTAFINIHSTYNAAGFPVSDLNGYGVSYVNNSAGDLLVVTVSVSWKQKNGRICGEDTNLNGVLDTGEDVNGNGRLDSSVVLIDRIYQR